MPFTVTCPPATFSGFPSGLCDCVLDANLPVACFATRPVPNALAELRHADSYCQRVLPSSTLYRHLTVQHDPWIITYSDGSQESVPCRLCDRALGLKRCDCGALGSTGTTSAEIAAVRYVLFRGTAEWAWTTTWASTPPPDPASDLDQLADRVKKEKEKAKVLEPECTCGRLLHGHVKGCPYEAWRKWSRRLDV